MELFKSREFNSDEVRNNIHIKRFGLIGNKAFKIITAWIGMIYYSHRMKIKCVHAHDITALPVAYLISRIKRVPLIYDSHELWTESHHKFNSRLVVKIVGFFEKILAKKAAMIITVSDSIKNHLCNHFDVKNITVIRNIPSYTHNGDYDIFRENYNIKPDAKILIYQGFIDFSRGVDLIIDAAITVCHANPNCFFFILGDGPDLIELKAKVKGIGLTDRIVFIGFVDQVDLLKYTKSADIGIHAIKNSCLNHEYCLPNKLFEYIHSGIVPVVTDLVELGGFVKSHKIGLAFKNESVSALEGVLLRLISDNDLFNELKSNLINTSEQVTWDNEFIKLKEVYTKVL